MGTMDEGEMPRPLLVNFSGASAAADSGSRTSDALRRAIAAQIRKALLAKGITRVAAEIGVHHTTVSRMQQARDDGGVSQIDEIAAFLAACGVRVVPESDFSVDRKLFDSLKVLARVALSGDATALEPGGE